MKSTRKGREGEWTTYMSDHKDRLLRVLALKACLT